MPVKSPARTRKTLGSTADEIASGSKTPASCCSSRSVRSVSRVLALHRRRRAARRLVAEPVVDVCQPPRLPARDQQPGAARRPAIARAGCAPRPFERGRLASPGAATGRVRRGAGSAADRYAVAAARPVARHARTGASVRRVAGCRRLARRAWSGRSSAAWSSVQPARPGTPKGSIGGRHAALGGLPGVGAPASSTHERRPAGSGRADRHFSRPDPERLGDAKWIESRRAGTRLRTPGVAPPYGYGVTDEAPLRRRDAPDQAGDGPHAVPPDPTSGGPEPGLPAPVPLTAPREGTPTPGRDRRRAGRGGRPDGRRHRPGGRRRRARVRLPLHPARLPGAAAPGRRRARC